MEQLAFRQRTPKNNTHGSCRRCRVLCLSCQIRACQYVIEKTYPELRPRDQRLRQQPPRAPITRSDSLQEQPARRVRAAGVGRAACCQLISYYALRASSTHAELEHESEGLAGQLAS